MGRTYRYLNGSKLRRLINCARAPGVQAVAVLRFGQWLPTLSIPLRIILEPVYFVLNGAIKILWGIELPRSARIGPGMYIGHFGGITVSAGTVIGNNCNLSQNVTIGVAGSGALFGAPVIGNNVYIAVGARIFGRITIGNDVKIGANAVVYKNVPDNAIVTLDPGFRIVSLKGNGPNISAIPAGARDAKSREQENQASSA